MNHDGVHAKLVRDQARVLTGCAPETLQHEIRNVVSFLQRHLLDGPGHVGDGYPQEALCDRTRLLCRAGLGCNPLRQRRELTRDARSVQGKVALRSEDRRKMGCLNFSHHDVGIGDRERSAPPIADRPWIGARAVRAHAEAATVEVEDRPSSGSDCVDGHHGHAQPGSGDLGVEGALPSAGIERYISRRAAHVQADHPPIAGRLGGAGGAHHSACRPRQDRVFALELPSVCQTAVGLHEIQGRRPELGHNTIHIVVQHGRQIGIDDCRVSPRHQTQQRAYLVTDRDLREASVVRELRESLLGLRELPGMRERDGDCLEALRLSACQHRTHRGLIDGAQTAAGRVASAADFLDRREQRLGLANLQIEQTRTGLRADAQQVCKAGVDQQQRASALVLEQRVRGHRRSHLDAADGVGGDFCIGRQIEGRADPGDRGILVARGIVAQQLDGAQTAVRRACHHVREGTAAIDPELPASCLHAPRLRSGQREAATTQRRRSRFLQSQSENKQSDAHAEQDP